MNALKSRIVNRVFGITGARNLLQETVDSVERATLDLHRSNRFARDLTYSQVCYSREEGVSKGRTVSLPSAIRRISEVLVKDPTKDAPVSATLYSNLTGYVQSTAPVKAMHVGSLLSVAAPFDFDTFIFGALTLPDVTDYGYNSWIAAEHDSAIVYTAAARVLSDLGDTSAVVNFQLAKSALDHLILDSQLVNV